MIYLSEEAQSDETTTLANQLPGSGCTTFSPGSGDGNSNTVMRRVAVKGWRSNNLGTGGAVAWCTAQVFLGVTRLRRVLRVLINSNVLEEFDGREAPSRLLAVGDAGSGGREWRRLMDADLELGSSRSTLKTELHNRLLLPQMCKERNALADMLPPTRRTTASSSKGGAAGLSIKQESLALGAKGDFDVLNNEEEKSPARFQQPLYSAILFGPPGQCHK